MRLPKAVRDLTENFEKLPGIGPKTAQRLTFYLLHVPQNQLESFAAFGSDLDAATQRQLTRGARLVQILKQPQYKPLPMEKQVTILFAGSRGYLDKYPVDVVTKYEAGLYPFIEERFPKVFEGLKSKKAIDADLEKLMNEALKAYDEEFKDTIK